jgi:hypothetical protein
MVDAVAYADAGIDVNEILRAGGPDGATSVARPGDGAYVSPP